jgi:hypothetical protein
MTSTGLPIPSHIGVVLLFFHHFSLSLLTPLARMSHILLENLHASIPPCLTPSSVEQRPRKSATVGLRSYLLWGNLETAHGAFIVFTYYQKKVLSFRYYSMLQQKADGLWNKIYLESSPGFLFDS